jgi:hypothetical protein
MKTHAATRSLVISSLALGCLLAFPMRTWAAETFCVVKCTDMDKRVEHKIMSPEEFKELDTQTKAEAALFPKAEEMAKKEWKADETTKSTPFPGRLGPAKVEVITREANRDKADKKLESLNAAEDRKQTEPRKSGKSSEAEKKQADLKAEKEKDLQKAYDSVKAKIAELMTKAEEAKPKTDEGKAKTEEAQPKTDEAKP